MQSLIQTQKELKTLIFKSNIRTSKDVARVARSFNHRKAILKWSVDLHDWERILKIQTIGDIRHDTIANWLWCLGYRCSELTH